MIYTKKYGEVDLEELEYDLSNKVWNNYQWLQGKLSDLWEELFNLEGYRWNEDKKKWFDVNKKKYINFWGGHDVVAFAEYFLKISKNYLYEWAINEGKIYKDEDGWKFA